MIQLIHKFKKSAVVTVALSLIAVSSYSQFTGPSVVPASGGGDGTGDVVGPSSATGDAIVRYNGTTGKLIKNSALTLVDGKISRAGGDVEIATTSSGAVILSPVGDVDVQAELDVARPSASSGVPFSFRVTDAAHTDLTTGPVPSVIFDLSSEKEITAGLDPFTVISGFDILAPTYSFTASQDSYVASTVKINKGPDDGTNGGSFESSNLLLGGISEASNTSDHSNLFIIPVGISDGVGDVNSRAGINISNGAGINLGNQTATLDEWSTLSLDKMSFSSDSNIRTVTSATTLKIAGPPAAADGTVSVTNAYAFKVNEGLSSFGGLLKQVSNSATANETKLDITGDQTADVDGVTGVSVRFDSDTGMTSGNTTYGYRGHMEGNASDTDHNYKIYNASTQKSGGTSSTTAFDVGNNFDYALHATSGDIVFDGYDAVIGAAIETAQGRNLTIHAGTPIGGNVSGGDLRLQTTAKAGSGNTGDVVIYGGASAAHFSSSQTTAPTVDLTDTVLNDAGGSGASASITAGSTDLNGKVTITSGLGGVPGTGKAATVVFNQPYKTAPKVVILTPAVPGAFNSEAIVPVITTTGFEIWYGALVSPGNTATFYYVVIG